MSRLAVICIPADGQLAEGPVISMTSPQDVWATKDMPVLREAAQRLEEGAPRVFEQPIVEATGLTIDQVRLSLAMLNEAGYLRAKMLYGDGELRSATATGMTEKGMRAVGFWPTAEQAADRLLQSLDSAIEHAETEDTRSLLTKIRDGFLHAGRDITVAVASAVLTGQIVP